MIYVDFNIDDTTYRAVVNNECKVTAWKKMYNDSEGFEWWDKCYKPEGISKDSIINYLREYGYLD